MAVTEDRIRELGETHLNEAGLEILEGLLSDGKLESAKYMLLGALDRTWKDGKMSTEEVQVLYAELGIPPEDSSRVRQDTGKL